MSIILDAKDRTLIAVAYFAETLKKAGQQNLFCRLVDDADATSVRNSIQHNDCEVHKRDLVNACMLFTGTPVQTYPIWTLLDGSPMKAALRFDPKYEDPHHQNESVGIKNIAEFLTKPDANIRAASNITPWELIDCSNSDKRPHGADVQRYQFFSICGEVAYETVSTGGSPYNETEYKACMNKKERPVFTVESPDTHVQVDVTMQPCGTHELGLSNRSGGLTDNQRRISDCVMQHSTANFQTMQCLGVIRAIKSCILKAQIGKLEEQNETAIEHKFGNIQQLDEAINKNGRGGLLRVGKDSLAHYLGCELDEAHEQLFERHPFLNECVFTLDDLMAYFVLGIGPSMELASLLVACDGIKSQLSPWYDLSVNVKDMDSGKSSAKRRMTQISHASQIPTVVKPRKRLLPSSDNKRYPPLGAKAVPINETSIATLFDGAINAQYKLQNPDGAEFLKTTKLALLDEHGNVRHKPRVFSQCAHLKPLLRRLHSFYLHPPLVSNAITGEHLNVKGLLHNVIPAGSTVILPRVSVNTLNGSKPGYNLSFQGAVKRLSRGRSGDAIPQVSEDVGQAFQGDDDEEDDDAVENEVYDVEETKMAHLTATPTGDTFAMNNQGVMDATPQHSQRVEKRKREVDPQKDHTTLPSHEDSDADTDDMELEASASDALEAERRLGKLVDSSNT